MSAEIQAQKTDGDTKMENRISNKKTITSLSEDHLAKSKKVTFADEIQVIVFTIAEGNRLWPTPKFSMTKKK